MAANAASVVCRSSTLVLDLVAKLKKKNGINFHLVESGVSGPRRGCGNGHRFRHVVRPWPTDAAVVCLKIDRRGLHLMDHVLVISQPQD